ncbi:hypothetical protein [Actinotignum urinale]|uniref:hypothetical protein n=1 Tax=Actinotignum urinale TaxID=190146 RepID=UPI002A82C4A8|nr:hypothetical protein [Actinotignum urinale]
MSAFLVVVSAMLCVLSPLALAVMDSTYKARDTFTSRFGLTREVPSQEADVQQRTHYISLGNRTAFVLMLSALKEDAPAPFGHSRWQEPGSFKVSEDLRDFIPELEAKFGTFAGVLDAKDTPSATSRLVLYRPLTTMTGDAWGFAQLKPGEGVSSQGVFGNDRVEKRQVVWFWLVVLVVPGVVLFYTVVRTWMQGHKQSLATLEIIGFTPWRIQRLVWRRLRGPILTALGLSVVCVGVLFVADVPLPGAQFTIRRIDTWVAWAGYATYFMLGVGLGLLVLFFATIPHKLAQTNRPHEVNVNRLDRVLALVGFVAVCGFSIQAVYQLRNAVQSASSGSHMVWFWAAVVTALVFAPYMCRYVVHVVGNLAVWLAHKKQSASLVIVGRHCVSGRGSARVVRNGVMLIVLAVTSASFALVANAYAIRMEHNIKVIDNRIARVDYLDYSKYFDGQGLWKSLDIPPYASISVYSPSRVLSGPQNHGQGNDQRQGSQGSGDEVRVYRAPLRLVSGSSEALRVWGFVVGKTYRVSSLPEFIQIALGPDLYEIKVVGELTRDVLLQTYGSTEGDVGSIYFNRDKSPVDRLVMVRAVSQGISPFVEPKVGGEEWIVGAYDEAFQFRWLYIGTGVIAVVLLGATLVSSRRDHNELHRKVVRLDSAYGTGGLPRLVAVLNGGVVAGTTLVLGSVLAMPISMIASGDHSVVGGVGMVIGGILLAVGVIFLAGIVGVLFATSRVQQRR